VAVVIASAVIPTLIAGWAFLPRHLLLQKEKKPMKKALEIGLEDEG